MSVTIARNALIGISLGLALTVVLLIGIFTALGVLEYLLPFLSPIFTYVGASILVMTVVIVFLFLREDRHGDLYTLLPLRANEFGEKLDRQGAVYIIPVYCPRCDSLIELNKIEWIGIGDMICRRCGTAIRTEIREHF